MIKFEVLTFVGTVNEDNEIIFDTDNERTKALAKEMQAALDFRLSYETSYFPGIESHLAIVVTEFGGKVLEFDPIVATEGSVN